MAFPILWRYLLSRYLKTLFLSIATFIAVLLVARFKEIARFGALSCDGGKTLLFTLYQIPYVLPIAIPISTLIASFLLFQTLSRSFELVAMRASGASFFKLSAPICLLSFLLLACNFSLSAELSPFCRRCAKELLYENTSLNPLLLLQRQRFMKLKRAYLRLHVIDEGKRAENFLLLVPNESYKRLFLVSANELSVAGEMFSGKSVATVSHLPSKKGGEFDPLIIENQEKMTTSASFLSKILKKNPPKLETASLSFRDLQFRKKEAGKKGINAQIEMCRRVALACSVFTFTLLGISFGIEPPRRSSRKNAFLVLVLTLLTLLGYFLGKEIKHNLFLSFVSLLAPQGVVILLSSLRLYLLRRGF